MSSEHLLDCCSSIVQMPMGCLRSWVGLILEVTHRSVLVLRLVRSQFSMFLSVHHIIPRD